MSHTKRKNPFTNYPLNMTTGSQQSLKVNSFYEWNPNELLLGTDKICIAFYDKIKAGTHFLQ